MSAAMEARAHADLGVIGIGQPGTDYICLAPLLDTDDPDADGVHSHWARPIAAGAPS